MKNKENLKYRLIKYLNVSMAKLTLFTYYPRIRPHHHAPLMWLLCVLLIHLTTLTSLSNLRDLAQRAHSTSYRVELWLRGENESQGPTWRSIPFVGYLVVRKLQHEEEKEHEMDFKWIIMLNGIPPSWINDPWFTKCPIFSEWRITFTKRGPEKCPGHFALCIGHLGKKILDLRKPVEYTNLSLKWGWGSIIILEIQEL